MSVGQIHLNSNIVIVVVIFFIKNIVWTNPQYYNF